MPNGNPLPPLFDFSHHGEYQQSSHSHFPLIFPNKSTIPADPRRSFALGARAPPELSIRPDLIPSIIPAHAEEQIYKTTSIDLQAGFEPMELDKLRVDID